jgi:hypothetical protein
MLDHINFKLGRKAVKLSPVHRRLSASLLDILPAPPSAVDNTGGLTTWGMMLNDSLGDCTIAGLGHSIQVASLAAGDGGTEETLTDDVILNGYETLCGYNPSDPSTDQGGVETDILSSIQKNGFSDRKLLGWVSPDPSNTDHLKKAIYYFKSLYIGAELPLSAQNAGVWDVLAGPNGVAGSWGGHCMVIPAYTPDQFSLITWGGIQVATNAWLSAYMDEAHALLWDDMITLFPQDTQDQILSLLKDVDS